MRPRRHYSYSITNGHTTPRPWLWVRSRDGGLGNSARARTIRSAMRWAARFGTGSIITRWYRQRKGEQGHRIEEWTYTGPSVPSSKYMVTIEQWQREQFLIEKARTDREILFARDNRLTLDLLKLPYSHLYTGPDLSGSYRFHGVRCVVGPEGALVDCDSYDELRPLSTHPDEKHFGCLLQWFQPTGSLGTLVGTEMFKKERNYYREWASGSSEAENELKEQESEVDA